MGTNIKLNKEIENRREISFDILNKLNSWNGDIDNIENILKDTENEINKLKIIEKNILKHEIDIGYDKKYDENIEQIVEKYEEIIRKIEIMQKDYLNIIKQIGKSDKVRVNYLKPERQSLFVDKDL